MIDHLQFPATCRPPHYYGRHPTYIVNTAKAAGIEVEVDGDTTLADCRFVVDVDGHETIFDFDNFPTLLICESGRPVFKFHTQDEHPPHVYPFPVVSFHDWAEYERLASEIEYTAEGDLISCRQKAHNAAEQRRRRVQAALYGAFPGNMARVKIPQQQYWREIPGLLCHVFVPGARNDMLDRAMAQHLAFGCCCVAPPIKTLLPCRKRLVPGEHFVQCLPDYSDLIDRVEWCHGHREECREIGANAKRLFQETSTPEAIWRWVEECL